MKKAFDQTVRELKREVNKKVLKVPGIEQKILDATSNEPWGPHGSLLADIAQATRNYHEYQIIMHVVWKRLNDTGKNWRHVYKALTVLEYLVGHGSERVIDEIRERLYLMLQTLSDFQYIDSSGKDQGNNVRRKSQILVSLVNDKEKVQEIREKANANKDKYRATFSSGGSHRSSSYSSTGGYGDRYDDDRYEGRYGSRDDDRNGYGRERDSGYRDDDQYGRGGNFYRDGDQYGRDADERYEKYKDDDSRGRSNDDYQFGPSKSFEKERDNSFEDDDNVSYRNVGGRANEASPNERHLEHEHSGQSLAAPPSYEAAVKSAPNVAQDERDGGAGAAVVTKPLSPTAPQASSPQSSGQGSHHSVAGAHPTLSENNTSFDEFDPRGSIPDSTTPAVSNASLVARGSEVDLFGNPSSLDPVNSLALVLMTTSTTNETEVKTNSDFGTNFVALSSVSAALSQPTEDPFGGVPFKAVPKEHFPSQQHGSVNVVSASSFLPSATSTGTVQHAPSATPTLENSLNFDFGDSFGGLTYIPTANTSQSAPTPTFSVTEFSTTQGTNNAHLGPTNMLTANTGYVHTSSPVFSSQANEPVAPPNVQTVNADFLPQLGSSIPQAASVPMQSFRSVAPQISPQVASRNPTLNTGLSPPVVIQQVTTSSGPPTSKPSHDKFETRSSVWADTLNKGLVNLDISGSKVNPLVDIGIDFDSINRMERRKEKEKSVSNPAMSTVSMGKAMGSGSGIGRAGAGALNPSRPNVGTGMGMGMGMGMGGQGIGVGGFGGAMNQPMGLNMGMSMGVGPGGPIRLPPAGTQPPPPGFPGVGYNSTAGMGNYGSQQPYGGGYR
ncbi:Clathrin interactor EPSIN 2 [Apostasia shenzhenica]|uniref:Clathrin interactor EPSIN 2 n=1 Tax=Apostasia shenzhenica TaxID=1088818 RepID=A0A2I0ACY5_9ASPA|nr:Clathrin interactor EPSIN 2 [Apostasia shenzhenica]